MTKQQLTNEQLDNIISSFSELIVDRMDMKDLEQYVYDGLVDFYEKCTVDEIRDYVNDHDEDLWEELLDNEGIKGEVDNSLKTTTYSLNVNESITFPSSSE